MDSLIFLMPIGFIILIFAFYAFFWTVRNNQYEDLDGAAQRILLDDEINNQDVKK